MARFRHLPIWKDAMDLALHLENAVRRFARYHKYTLGSELRQTAQRLCRLAAQTGHFRTGFRRREIVEFWYPPSAAAAQALFSSTPRDDR